MKLQRMLLPALTLTALIAGPSAYAGLTFEYKSFDTPVGIDSFASDISNNGVIIGSYYTPVPPTQATATFHGYELQNGAYTYFDAPNAGTGNSNGTLGESVNSHNQAIFIGYDNNGLYTSYLALTAAGNSTTYTALDDPNAVAHGTLALTIDDSGIVTGGFDDGVTTHGFTYSTVTNMYSTLADAPGATATYALGSDASGDLLVAYIDADGHYHGALYTGGSYTNFINVPGALDTTVYGINASGVVVGYYDFAAGGATHGFELIDGTYYTVDYPGAVTTLLNGINDHGQAVGSYIDPDGFQHGFIATAVPEPGSLVGLAGLAATLLPAWLIRRRSARK